MRSKATATRRWPSTRWRDVRLREGVQLKGKRLGIIGIGAEVARIARGIGMEVLAWNRAPRPDVAAPTAIEDLLRAADVVSLHLALTEGTKGFLDRSRLAMLKRGAILVNTARGTLVDEEALLYALNEGIARAGLDVFALEPARADHPLAMLESVTLSAHSGFCTLRAFGDVAHRALVIVWRLAAQRSGG